ncbi:MAG: asparagine synthetase B family protein, partial [Gammaproteobacteria bacterium]
QIVFAARDRFGIKPLYWTELGGRLLIASEAKAILEAGAVPVWNRDAYLRTLFLCQPPGATLFAGINQVPPGHYLVSDGTTTRVTQYWDLDYPPDDARREPVDERGARRALRARLEEAIRLRLRADVHVGVFLSGGIDSSTVAGMAASLHDGPLSSFTVRFADRVFDEGAIARRTAARIRSNHTEVRVTLGELAEHWEDAVWHGETLAANAHGVARYLQ